MHILTIVPLQIQYQFWYNLSLKKYENICLFSCVCILLNGVQSDTFVS